MKYSFIIPVYNRPEEVDELLESLRHQTFDDFEVLIIEDGSAMPCVDVVKKHTAQMEGHIHYFTKTNSGPGQTRNYGAERASGDYLLILDSDVVLPPDYLEEVDKELRREACDAFGGPDRAHESFSPVQKSINYAMTSFFTTGGIRGGKKKLDKFYPRSFNMGVKREKYLELGGFSKMRFGEDIDFSTRIFEAGCGCRLFPKAWVWHKRRTDFKKFFKQVHNSGIARINLEKRHPGTMKLVHTLPALFTIGLCGCLLLSLWKWWFIIPLLFFSTIIFLDSSIRERSAYIGLLSIAASLVQLTGYGTGFIRAWWERCVMGRGEFGAFKNNFYK